MILGVCIGGLEEEECGNFDYSLLDSGIIDDFFLWYFLLLGGVISILFSYEFEGCYRFLFCFFGGLRLFYYFGLVDFFKGLILCRKSVNFGIR